MNYIESVQIGLNRKGKKSLLNHLTGVRLTKAKAIEAMCYSCNGMGEETECSIAECPLLPYSQFKVGGLDVPSKD